jgi:hypothetical protein
VTVVRAAAVGTPVRSALGLGEWEMGGGDECGEEGRAPRPFIWSDGGAGRPDEEGDRVADVGGINAGRPVRWGGKQRGEWGVMRGQNVSPFLGEEGSSGQRQRAWEVAAVAPDWAFGGRRRPGRLTGRAHLLVRGRQRGRLGQKVGGREVGHGWVKRGRERGGP